MKKFPDNFIWGTATAAYQIEGHEDEVQNKLSDWSNWIDHNVMQPTNQGSAIKHIEHLDQDLKLIHDLGAGAYRFSFNWATLHRGPGQFCEDTLDFYRRLLDGLGDVEPMATIWHFTLPQWIAEKGGWENSETPQHFREYTEFLLKHFGDKIKNWLTINEPNIFLWFGYESGIWPPGHMNSWEKYLKAYEGMSAGHHLAYKAIKKYNPELQVGFAQNLYYLEAQSKSDHDAVFASVGLRKKVHNHSFIESCIDLDALDFLGVNYYTRLKFKFNDHAKDPINPENHSILNIELLAPDEKTNDLGWEIYPDGLFKVLTDPALMKLLEDRPIYITENGYSCLEDKEHPGCQSENSNSEHSTKDVDDGYRIEFIKEHLDAIHRALQVNKNISGYFYWSLFDNFEWALGMEPRFGLIHVDHESYERTPKASYNYYAQVCKLNSI